MQRARLIQAKLVRSRSFYNDQGVDLVLSNMFNISICLTVSVIWGIMMGVPYSFGRADMHINAKFSISGKVYSFRTSEKIFKRLKLTGHFKSEKFKQEMIDGRYH